MTATFCRLNTDQTREPIELENLFAGPTLSSCWMIGGGPSLNALPSDAIRESPVPKMCINLSGTKLMRPTFWTSYDPSARFHRSVYLDPGVMKFVHRRRAMDLVPETTFKVCDCPNTFFFERDGDRGFSDFLSPEHRKIVDWADSMVQAIDILYRLGFRILYLAGCEMRVQPSKSQFARAAELGIHYDPQERFNDFLKRCHDAGLTANELDQLEPGRHYHFDESKSIQAAANTDSHYFRIAQYLRLSRRSMSLAGMQLISVTPHSRLNDYFPYVPTRKVLRQIDRRIGNPEQEPVRGLYRQTEPRQSRVLGPMQDFKPHHWTPEKHLNPPRKRHQEPIQQPERDGELLVEAEGFEQLPRQNGRNGDVLANRLLSKLDRFPMDDHNPHEEG